MAKENKPRMHYMDLLKGIAIFMVVMGHVLTICIRDIDAATIFKIIGEVQSSRPAPPRHATHCPHGHSLHALGATIPLQRTALTHGTRL